jgi:bidirectional [NiFe] hydrogenase diaphorase subunit
MMPEELADIAAFERETEQQYQHRIHVCVASGCLSSQSDQLRDALDKEVNRRGEERWCQVKGVGCMGLCTAGPLLSVDGGTIHYEGAKVSDAFDIVDGITEGKVVDRLICNTNVPFFQRQNKVVMENSGSIDPERIEDYIAADGYSALLKTLTELHPGEVTDEVAASGLRGRGEGGYPTALKWGTVAKAQGTRKFVICNADEGDPGAFMDRTIIESDPHRVLEGMAIAAYAVGADHGYIYVRAEYPLAIQRLRKAIQQAERMGLLGNRIFGTTFNFNIEVRLGAGAFVCGEETALIASIEGKRGSPRPRPPYPAEYGLWGEPTLINNVETFANVPSIIRKGSGWYAGIGTKDSPGTKVFALAGRVNNTGIIEVAMGITLREIIYDIGGGIPDGHDFKAVQTGGPSGGCIPEQYLDMTVDYESLAKVGSIMGSGGMIIMDDTSSMVDVAKFFIEFCMTESCGKCVPCRVGTAQIYDLMEKISQGAAGESDLDMLMELCEVVKSTSLCGLGQSAPNPVLSTLHYFRNEYLSHIRK